jgi:uncharacterized membrane protein
MDTIILIVQVVLGLAFMVLGAVHLTQRSQHRTGMEWLQDVPAPVMATISVLEILGGIGLIVPWVTGILPILAPVAAVALVALMLFAMAFHARRHGEAPNIAFNVVLGLVAAFVAYGRFILEPFA